MIKDFPHWGICQACKNRNDLNSQLICRECCQIELLKEIRFVEVIKPPYTSKYGDSRETNRNSSDERKESESD